MDYWAISEPWKLQWIYSLVSFYSLISARYSEEGTQKYWEKKTLFISQDSSHKCSVSIHNIVYIGLYCYFMTNVWHLRKMMRSNKLLSRETCRPRVCPERDTKMTQNFFLISNFSHLLYFVIRKSQVFFTYNDYGLQDYDRHSDVNTESYWLQGTWGTPWWDAFVH